MDKFKLVISVGIAAARDDRWSRRLNSDESEPRQIQLLDFKLTGPHSMFQL